MPAVDSARFSRAGPGSSEFVVEVRSAVVKPQLYKSGTQQRACAYVTLFSQDSYLPGVLALLKSAGLVGLRFPVVVMHTSGVSPAALHAIAKEGAMLRSVERFTPAGVDSSKYVRALYAECWAKLRMWEWEEYERLVYLDADMLLLKNVDHLFDLPPAPLYAVGDCYGGREAAQERDACCHFTPAAPPAYFNAGFYVMTPDRGELRRMQAALAAGTVQVGRFSEQDFLNGYFAGAWRHLPYIYNAQKRIKYHHPALWDLQEIAILHYVDEKPWSHRFSEENLAYTDICDYWWDVYEGRLAPSAPLLAAEPHARQAPRQYMKAVARAASLASAVSLGSTSPLHGALVEAS